MPDLHDKIYALDTRVSNVEKDVSFVTLNVNHMEKTVIDHMEKEEKDREIMDQKLDGLLRYKWILFGMMLMMWLTSGENQILSLLKLLG